LDQSLRTSAPIGKLVGMISLFLGGAIVFAATIVCAVATWRAAHKRLDPWLWFAVMTFAALVGEIGLIVFDSARTPS
jgi:hypothetical protein